MRELVIDASIAAKWVVEEDHSVEAVRLLGHHALYAPAHWRAEAVNALWPKVSRGDLAVAEAEQRMLLLNRAPVTDTAISVLMPRAFAIAVEHSVTIYNSLYVALSEQRDIEMVTADARLIRGLREDAALHKRIVWVGDLPS